MKKKKSSGKLKTGKTGPAVNSEKQKAAEDLNFDFKIDMSDFESFDMDFNPDFDMPSFDIDIDDGKHDTPSFGMSIDDGKHDTLSFDMSIDDSKHDMPGPEFNDSTDFDFDFSIEIPQVEQTVKNETSKLEQFIEKSHEKAVKYELSYREKWSKFEIKIRQQVAKATEKGKKRQFREDYRRAVKALAAARHPKELLIKKSKSRIINRILTAYYTWAAVWDQIDAEKLMKKADKQSAINNREYKKCRKK